MGSFQYLVQRSRNMFGSELLLSFATPPCFPNYILQANMRWNLPWTCHGSEKSQLLALRRADWFHLGKETRLVFMSYHSLLLLPSLSSWSPLHSSSSFRAWRPQPSTECPLSAFPNISLPMPLGGITLHCSSNDLNCGNFEVQSPITGTGSTGGLPC